MLLQPPLQQISPMTFLTYLIQSLLRTVMGLKGTGTKQWFLKLLNIFEKPQQTLIHILKICPFIFAT